MSADHSLAFSGKRHLAFNGAASGTDGVEKAGTLNGTRAYNELYGIMIHLLCTLAEMAHRMK
ncbi:hypothetical protein BRO54_2534 [Geobacillus proteiniphilus]|uniref:Uncharacterized protein n=1 Tax=Geobacillus proteiniphilus TaxID=860353 RepID=A0A1Q5SVB0_9BACL|nr:hypothetical protein BRO54_2534 [Geobacillus proteiniphilus]OPX03303.1 hypothetical protein B1A75_08915 [Geobacillus sp. LEMMY01]